MELTRLMEIQEDDMVLLTAGQHEKAVSETVRPGPVLKAASSPFYLHI